MTALVRRQVDIDVLLFSGTLLLVVIGAIMVASTSISIADRASGEPFYYLYRHLGALGIGAVGFVVVLAVPMEVWNRLNVLFLIGTLLLLVSVLIPGVGHTVNGSARWVDVGPIQFQPSEPARVCFLLYLSSYAVRYREALANRLGALLRPVLVLGLAGVLLLAEPDFGAFVVLAAACFGVLFVGGARLRDLAAITLVGGAAMVMVALSAAYRVERLTSFLDPWSDPFASGFQLTQALMAIGRGGWFGAGLGESVEKLFYLPEAHTDFVFAIAAEELGLVGSTVIIVLFSILVYRMLVIGRRAIEADLPFHGLVATSIGLILGIQAFVNIGVNIGLMPTKGITLPLLSYGRTSTVVTLVALGLVFRVYRELRIREQSLGKGRKPG